MHSEDSLVTPADSAANTAADTQSSIACQGEKSPELHCPLPCDPSPSAQGLHQQLPVGKSVLMSEALTLGLDDPAGVSRNALETELEKHLFGPLRHLMERPSKCFRKRLVKLGFDLVQTRPAAGPMTVPLDRAGDLLEILHLGSLIIDDIQDGSLDRRGAPALHRLIGMPRALCAGNFLYFRALNTLRTLGLAESTEREAFATYGETMENAHLGQMLDLSLRASTVDSSLLPELCEKVSLLKTGCLTAFALKLGAMMGSASPEQIAQVSSFGLAYGTLLQYCDDLGNTTAGLNPSKRFEDLKQDKPTSLWTLVHRLDAAAEAGDSPKKSSTSLFEDLRRLAHPENIQQERLQQERLQQEKVRQEKIPLETLAHWFQDSGILNKSRRLLQKEIKTIFDNLYAQNVLSHKALRSCQEMTEELLDAYTLSPV